MKKLLFVIGAFTIFSSAQAADYRCESNSSDFMLAEAGIFFLQFNAAENTYTFVNSVGEAAGTLELSAQFKAPVWVGAGGAYFAPASGQAGAYGKSFACAEIQPEAPAEKSKN